MESLGNDDRLLEDLLLHVVAVIALLDRRGRGARLDDLALHRSVIAVEYLNALAAHDRPVALVQISDPLRPGRDRDCVRPEIVLALAVPDGQRRAHARRDQQVWVVAEQESNGKGAR